MHDSTGFLTGLLIGALLTACFAAWVRDQGRDECDNKLLRTEKCVQVWVPEKSIKGDTPSKAEIEPLTDAQIAEMMRDTWGCASIAPRHALEFARAVERAHNIPQKGGD